jgi:hypothetical protein
VSSPSAVALIADVGRGVPDSFYVITRSLMVNMETLALLAIVLVIGVYFFAKAPVDEQGKVLSRNTFRFLDARTGEPTQHDNVTNSNVAANFQMLSVYPNIVFGMLGNLAVPLLNAIAFGIGALIFRRRGMKYKAMIEEGDSTVHGFVARVHSFPRLKRYTTLVSLAVFTSVVAFEVVFLARILSALMGGSQTAYYTLIFSLIFFLSSAVYFGGQKSTFFADNLHLAMAYIGVHLCLGTLARLSGARIYADSVLLVIGISTAIMIGFRIRVLMQKSGSLLGRSIGLLITGSAVYLLVMVISSLPADPHAYWHDADVRLIHSFPKAASVRVTMILAAVCPAIFANFVDFSFWHRLRAVRTEPIPTQEQTARFNRGINVFLIEAPLSWILPLSIGVLALSVMPGAATLVRTGEEDPVAGLVKWLLNSHGALSLIGFLFVVGLLSVAVSTVDAYLTSLSYLFAKDITNESRDESDRISAGRGFQFIVALFIVVIFVVLDIFANTSLVLLTIFLTAFAPLTALSPLVVWPLLTGKTYSSQSALQSFLLMASCMGAGAVGLALGIWAVVVAATPEEVLYWIATPAAFVCSWVLYFCYLVLAVPTGKQPCVERAQHG